MTLADVVTASSPVTAAKSSKKGISNKSTTTPAVNAASTNEDRPRINSPAFQVYEDKKNACNAKITDIRARIDAIKNGYSMAGGENLSEKNKKLRIELIDKVKTLRGELHSIEDERRALSTQFGETLESLKKKNADVNAAKDKMSFKSTAEIDERIREIESTLESGRFTLSEERQMLQEVTKLRKMRKALENVDGTTGNDVASLRLRLDQIKLRQGDVEGRITAKKQEISAVNSQIDALVGIRAAEDAKKADSKTAIEKLRKEMDAEYSKRNAAWDEYLQVKNAKEAAYHRMVARRAEEDRVAAIEDEIDELERKLGHLTTESVIDKKWNECTNLINYFLPYTPTAVIESDRSTVIKAINRGGLDLSKVQVLKKEEECYFVPSNKKKQNQNRSAEESNNNTDELSKLPFHILAALTDMSLPIPKSVEKDLPDLLRTIETRRADLQQHRDASISEMNAKRNVIIQEIEGLRNKIDSKEEQITAAAVKKAEKAEKLAEAAVNDETTETIEVVEVVEVVEDQAEN